MKPEDFYVWQQQEHAAKQAARSQPLSASFPPFSREVLLGKPIRFTRENIDQYDF